MLHMDSDRGFVLQVLHPNTVRVIQVFETFECFSSLKLRGGVNDSRRDRGRIRRVRTNHDAPASSPPEEVGIAEDTLSDGSSESMLDLVDGTGMEDMGLGTTASGGSGATEVGMWC